MDRESEKYEAAAGCGSAIIGCLIGTTWIVGTAWSLMYFFGVEQVVEATSDPWVVVGMAIFSGFITVGGIMENVRIVVKRD